ncbi:hypothetical protein, partial [Streptomyces lunaelactis]|uniref:hypothetical protein n=1 Tax=Streptomyces lunaelactis TaxID=1535768 RepID=UPI0020C77C76
MAVAFGTQRRSCATGTLWPSRVVTSGSPEGRAGPFPLSAVAPLFAGRTTIRPVGGGATGRI